MTAGDRLVVHVVAYRAGPGGPAAVAQLTQVWADLIERYGLRDAVDDLPLDLVDPAATRAVAARRGPAGRAVHRIAGDAQTLALLLDPSVDGCAAGEVVDHVRAALSAALGIAVARLVVTDTPDDLGARVARGLTAREERHDDAHHDRPEVRRLTVTGACDDALVRWAWAADDGGSSPLARYMLAWARLRDDFALWERARFRAAAQDVDLALVTLLEILVAEQRSDVELARDDREVAVAQAHGGGLVANATRLREMQRGALARHAELAAEVASVDGMFGRDARFAAWFAHQLGQDAIFVETVRERAREVNTLAAAAVQRRLLLAEDHRRDAEAEEALRRERVNLLQGAVVSAVVVALGAIQAFEYTIGAPRPVQTAIIVLISVTALWLSVLGLAVARPARAGYGTALIVVSGLLGGALALLVVGIVPGLPTWPAVGGGLAVGLVGAGVVRVRSGHSSS